MAPPFASDSEARTLFLGVLAEAGTITFAAAAAGIHRSTVIRLRQHDETFSAECADAIENFRDSLRDAITLRGRDGVDEPVFFRGEVCGHVHKFSDQLLLAQAKAHMPEYRERVDISGNISHSIADIVKAAAIARNGNGTAQLPDPGGSPNGAPDGAAPDAGVLGPLLDAEAKDGATSALGGAAEQFSPSLRPSAAQ